MLDYAVILPSFLFWARTLIAEYSKGFILTGGALSLVTTKQGVLEGLYSSFRVRIPSLAKYVLRAETVHNLRALFRLLELRSAT